MANINMFFERASIQFSDEFTEISRSPPLCLSIDVFFYPGLGIDKGISRDCSVSPIALRYMN